MFEITYRIDPSASASSRRPESSADARALIEEGNAAFADAMSTPVSAGTARRVIPVAAADVGLATAEGTALPRGAFAIVVGCADARVPIELILGQHVNSLFVLRVAGNVLGGEILGSIDFALQNLPSLRLAMVLGHSRCGAVTAAVETFLRPDAYLGLTANHQLRSIVNQILPAVRIGHAVMLEAWGPEVASSPDFAAALVEISTVVNAALMAASLESEVRSSGANSLDAVFGVYDLETRRVGVPRASRCREMTPELLPPPSTPDDFFALARDVAAGPTVRQLLGEQESAGGYGTE